MKPIQTNLFEDPQIKYNQNDLILKVNIEKKILSKKQKEFNILTSKIESEQKKLTQKESNFERIISIYAQKVQPIKSNFIENLKKTTLAIYAKKKEFSKEIKKNDHEILDEILLVNINYYKYMTEINDLELNTILCEIENINIEDKIEEEAAKKLSILEFYIKHLNIKIDLSEYGQSKTEILEHLEEIQHRIDEESEKYEEKMNQEEEKSKKKNKKEREIESKIAKTKEAKTKNISTIYKQLAKLLHPDLEQDPMLKLEKEELMKEVILAFKNKDLYKLLQLELKWITKDSNNLTTLTDEKLEVYNEMLREQLNEISTKNYQFKYNPRYSFYIQYYHHNIKSSITKILKVENDYSDHNQQIEIQFKKIENANLKKMQELIKLQKNGSENFMYGDNIFRADDYDF